MLKPSPILLKLAAIGSIQSIVVKYVQTGTDTAETMATIVGLNGNHSTGKWSSFEPYLELKVNHNSVARLSPGLLRQAEAWNRYEAENQAELAEYKRLKQKFEGTR